MCRYTFHSSFFFFNDTATTEIYTLSLHDALPISYAIGIITLYVSHAICTTRGRQVMLRERDREETDPERPAPCPCAAGAVRARIRPHPRRERRRRVLPHRPALSAGFAVRLDPRVRRHATGVTDSGAVPRACGPGRAA